MSGTAMDMPADEPSKKRTRSDADESVEGAKRSKVAEDGADATKAPKDGEVAINDDEAALYDRQIRLWGMDGQQRYC